MTLILTGGAGFIGSNVLKALNDQGVRDIIIVDELGESESWKNLVGKTFTEILLPDQLFDWLLGKEKSVEAIIHLGACSSTVEKDASYLLKNNTQYSMRLAEMAFEHGIRFIYASSAATYGDGRLGFSDEHEVLSRLRPLNMYGYSKHLFDLWLQEKGYLDRAVGLKYFNVFGPNEYHKGRMASAVLKMVPDVLHRGKISLFQSSEKERFGDGDQVRDFIYVKDAALMTIQFLKNAHTGIFNVGTGIEGTWNTMAAGVIEGLGKRATIEYIEMPEDLIGKYQNYTRAEMKKSQALGLYTPQYGLKEAVIEYVRDYVSQERGV